VDHRALDVAPLCDVVSADDDHVERNFETAKLSAKPGGLRATPWNLRLDYEQVEVRFGAGIAASVRAKEDHPRVWGGLGESAARLCNQGLIRHGVKVAHGCDGRLEGAWRDVLKVVTRFTLEVEGNEKPCFVGDSVTRVMAPAA
jgi:hypothetical protein